MKYHIVRFLAIVTTLVFLAGCNTSTSNNPSKEEPVNQFVGTWEAEHKYTSGYTDPVAFPVAMDTLSYTLVIKSDGSFTESYKAVYANKSVITGFYSGTYGFEENIITLTFSSMTNEGGIVTTENLPSPSIFELTNSVLLEINSTSAECPTKDSNGNLMYPIVLSFAKK